MSSNESKLAQGADIWGRLMNPSPDECIGPFPKTLEYPSSSQEPPSTVAQCYVKHEMEVLKCESKINEWLEKAEKKSKEVLQSKHSEEGQSRSSSYKSILNKEKLEKVYRKTITPSVKQNFTSFIQQSEKFIESKTKRLHES